MYYACETFAYLHMDMCMYVYVCAYMYVVMYTNSHKHKHSKSSIVVYILPGTIWTKYKIKYVETLLQGMELKPLSFLTNQLLGEQHIIKSNVI